MIDEYGGLEELAELAKRTHEQRAPDAAKWALEYIKELEAEIKALTNSRSLAVDERGKANIRAEAAEAHLEDKLVDYDAGFQLAHDAAKCGHARANYKDPAWGTPDYPTETRCEFCDKVFGLKKENEGLARQLARLVEGIKKISQTYKISGLSGARLDDLIAALSPAPALEQEANSTMPCHKCNEPMQRVHKEEFFKCENPDCGE